MNFLVAAQLPPSLADWLRARGRDARHLFDIGMETAADRDVRDLALQDGDILVTKDSDFVMAIAPRGLRVVWLRFGNLSNRALFAELDRDWAGTLERLKAGQEVIELP